jgi:hypothetical protein
VHDHIGNSFVIDRLDICEQLRDFRGLIRAECNTVVDNAKRILFSISVLLIERVVLDTLYAVIRLYKCVVVIPWGR